MSVTGSSVTVRPASAIRGELVLPGDKSISHRALLIAALSTEPVELRNLATSRDVDATADAIVQLGAIVEHDDDEPGYASVTGLGMRGLRAPGEPIDARNAGTLARLLPGILAGQPEGTFTISGDESLSRRPMERVVTPLRQMGAKIEPAAGGTLPLRIEAGGALEGIEYELPVASAQVQSAVMLAGLYAATPTTIHEPGPMRDHTERMLRRAGARVERRSIEVTVWPAESLQLPDTVVAADPSSAAFFVAAATLLPESLLRLPGVLANPGRAGFVELLEKMGARIGVSGRRELDGEPIYDLEVEHAKLERVHWDAREVPRLIDELPLLGLVAHFCRGETNIRGAAELRVKESDRIASTVRMLRAIGIVAEEREDGFVVRGSSSRPEGGTVDPEGDHRIAMVAAIAGLVSRNGVTIEGADCAAVSFPGFYDAVEALAVR